MPRTVDRADGLEQARALTALAAALVGLDTAMRRSLRERAVRLAAAALASGGGNDARLALARALIHLPSRGEEAAAHVLALVGADDADAHCMLGWLLYRGEGVGKDDVASRRHHHIAAERGVADAQFELSIYFDQGIGGSIDPAQARRWELRAADQGHGRACLNVGAWAATGALGAIDMARAVVYYERAAAAGHAGAAQRLAIMYSTGAGIAADAVAGARWARLAAQLGAERPGLSGGPD